MSLKIEDLYLYGTTEPFYLEEGEEVLWIRDNTDGTALVRVKSPAGWEDVIDAEIKPTTKETA